MSDGNTAIQVSPEHIDWSDANMVHGIMQSLGNKLVDASNLKREVDELRSQITAMNDTLRELMSERDTFRRERDQARVELDNERIANSHLRDRLNATVDELESTKGKLSDAEYRGMEYEDQVKALNAHVDRLKAEAQSDASEIHRLAEHVTFLHGKLADIQSVLQRNHSPVPQEVAPPKDNIVNF